MSDYPNVVLVVFDTARRDRFGCYGYERPTTPTVDSLAREGLVLDTMIANAPWTPPSHGSLFTGLYPTQHGSQWQTGPALRDSVSVTMAEFLGGLGYDTWCVTNNGLISSRTRLARGFDTYAYRLELERGVPRVARRVPKLLFGGDSGGRTVNRWMRKRLKEARRPLFLFVNYNECHWSYAPPPSLVRRVGGPRHRALKGLGYRVSTAARVGPWEAVARADRDDLEVLSTLYDGELANADRHVEELLGILEASGRLREPTLVVVTSDHGEHLGEHGLADHHGALDDILIHVPFVAWGSGLVPSRRSGDVFEFVDVFPSLLALLGHPMPEPLGARRAGVFEGRGSDNNMAFAEWRSWPEGERQRLERRNPSYDFSGLAKDLVCARDSRFKLVRASDGSRSLFDLSVDPEETTDRTAEHPEEAMRLGAALDVAVAEWAASEGKEAELRPDEQAEIEQRLEELGYI